jgi:choline dehydrogenase-like flavoprotein
MIEDARRVPDGTRLEADLCVIGGGAAGLTLAHALAGRRLRVLLLESGGLRRERETETLNEGEVADSRHSPPQLYRQRRLGGATGLWGGRCIPFDEVDFARRDHVPLSGWPIGAAALAPWYREAMALCQAGELSYTAGEALPDRPPEMVPGFRSASLRTDRIERFSPPTDFGRTYGLALARAGNVRLLLHATCIGLEADHSGRRVQRVAAATLAGNRLSIAARRFVLAGGGLETTRLMLAANAGRGLGSGRALLGRCYMCHIEGVLGRLSFTPPGRPLQIGFERSADGIYCRRLFTIDPAVQRTRGLLQFVARPHHPSIVDPAHGDGILSSMFLVKGMIVPEYRSKMTRAEFSAGARAGRDAAFWGGHLRNVLRDAPRIAVFGLGWVGRRNLARRKIPYVILPRRDATYPLEFTGEQSPDPASRVALSAATDRFGLPRLRVEWRMSELDVASIAGCFALMRDELAAGGVAALTLEPDLVDRIRACHPTGGHHIGTTRMSASPAEGVVDADCRVFGIDNLYLCSSSVFPTSGYANPTLTIVALAARLAAHLEASAIGIAA